MERLEMLDRGGRSAAGFWTWLMPLALLVSCAPEDQASGRDHDGKRDRPLSVARDYLNRWYEGDGSHDELELAWVPEDLKIDYASHLPPAEGRTMRSVELRSSAGTGPGRGGYERFSFSVSIDNATLSNTVAFTVYFKVTFHDGSTASPKICLRPLEIGDVTDGSEIGPTVTWGVMPPLPN